MGKVLTEQLCRKEKAQKPDAMELLHKVKRTIGGTTCSPARTFLPVGNIYIALSRNAASKVKDLFFINNYSLALLLHCSLHSNSNQSLQTGIIR